MKERLVKWQWQQIKYDCKVLKRLMEERGINTDNLTPAEIIDKAHDSLCIDEHHFDLHHANCTVCNK